MAKEKFNGQRNERRFESRDNYSRNNNSRDNQTNNRRNPAKDRVQQKIELLQKHPNAQVFVRNSKVGDQLFRAIKIIDAADTNIRDEWGFNVTETQMKKWNDDIQKLIELAEKVRDAGIELVANSKDVRDVEVMALKKEVSDFLDKKAEKETAKESSVADKKSSK